MYDIDLNICHKQALWKAGKKISDPMLVDSSLPTRKAKFKRITEIITTPRYWIINQQAIIHFIIIKLTFISLLLCRFQNATTVIMNFAFLALYTYVVNCTDYKSDAPGITEWLLYIWAFGFLIQEFNKVWIKDSTIDQVGFFILMFTYTITSQKNSTII